MNCFVVAITPNSLQAVAAVEKYFPEYRYEVLESMMWVVASPEHYTCSDVCKMIGIDQEGGLMGMVSKLNEFYGFFDVALWEKINLWRDMS